MTDETWVVCGGSGDEHREALEQRIDESGEDMTTKTTKRAKKAAEQPIILCCGERGRAVVYGYTTGDPVPGQPVELRRARMLIRWTGTGGLFGVAASGPADGSTVTCAVERTTETRWQEWIAVSPEAARRFDSWR